MVRGWRPSWWVLPIADDSTPFFWVDSSNLLKESAKKTILVVLEIFKRKVFSAKETRIQESVAYPSLLNFEHLGIVNKIVRGVVSGLSREKGNRWEHTVFTRENFLFAQEMCFPSTSSLFFCEFSFFTMWEPY